MFIVIFFVFTLFFFSSYLIQHWNRMRSSISLNYLYFTLSLPFLIHFTFSSPQTLKVSITLHLSLYLPLFCFFLLHYKKRGYPSVFKTAGIALKSAGIGSKFLSRRFLSRRFKPPGNECGYRVARPVPALFKNAGKGIRPIPALLKALV